ncbi:MAG TPA: anti-sigma factor [Solirubrobacteraceae bacterium]
MTRHDDDIPAELRDVAARLRALGPAEWDLAAPPPLRATVAERHAPVERGRRAPRRGRFAAALVRRPAFAAAAALVLVVLGTALVALLAGGDGSPGAGREVALAAVGDGPRGAHAAARLRATTMQLTVSGLPRVGAGGFYEVWMMRDATHLVALGSFRVGADGRAHVELPVTASPRRFPVLDVSREAADGDPAHSGHSVLRSRPIDS